MFDTGEFKKFDYGAEENMAKYGAPAPPVYDLNNIKGFEINLVCGKDDKLVSPKDYEIVKDLLIENGNIVHFSEYDLGHLGLLMPHDLQSTDKMVENILEAQ